MTTSSEIKKMARHIGADLCGIAPLERFKDAPIGFHPLDIYPGTKSVIAVAKRESRSVLHSKSPVPYTFATETIKEEIFRMMMILVLWLEDRGHIAIPIPSEPYEYWDEKEMTGKGIISLKHIGHLAGLGVIGRNTLLINRKYGNFLRLGAIVTDAILEGDPLENHILCGSNCNLCIKSCPTNAIGEATVVQKRCRLNSSIVTKKGDTLYTCNVCRKVCPYTTGFERTVAGEPISLSKIVKVKFG